MQSKTFNLDELTLEDIEPKQSAENNSGNVGRQCLKCSHVRLASEGATPSYECPKCGAIYDKVEQLLSASARLAR